MTLLQTVPQIASVKARRGYSPWLLRHLSWLGRRSGRERFGELAARATAIRQRTEPEFQQLVRDLRALHVAAAELSQTTRDHVSSMRDALEQNRLNGEGVGDRAFEELCRGLEEVERRLRTLRSNCDAMRQLKGHGSQLQRVTSLLEVAGYGFAVESARSLASQQAFGAFVTEFRRLSQKVGELGQSIFEHAKAAQDESERLHRSMTASLAELRKLTEQTGATVRQSSEQIKNVLAASWSALEEIERGTVRITSHASDAVYQTQFGDIVRQKLEHVAEAFGEASTEQGGQVLLVQSGQLELVGEEIARARKNLDRAFAGLAEGTRSLADTISRFGGNSGEDGRDTFAELRAAFGSVEHLQRCGLELCQGARATSERATETAARLSRYIAEVEEINRQMHLQALNAIVKTALLGSDGQPLEILSMHVQRVFEESNTLVAETVKVIESLSTGESESSGAVDAADDTGAALQRDLGQLAHIQDEFRRALGVATAQSDRQAAALERARGDLGVLSEIEDEIAALRREMAAVRESVFRGAGTARAGEQRMAVSGRYTIASEHEVHRRVMQGVAARGFADEPPVATATEDENNEQSMVLPSSGTTTPDQDLGDNVELF
jgi:hypothetical protein